MKEQPPQELPAARCWCGNARLKDFSPDYWRCPECETLVVRAMKGAEVSVVSDDESDLYGKSYYLKHVVEDYGFPGLEARARADLTERCLHWLRTFLKYAPPGGRALELGSAHGGFVALLRWAGFDATGLELSPWLVKRARELFGVPMLTGRVEDQTTLADGSLDVIAFMDVLEHLPEPRATLARCVSLLRPGGFLLVQTPCFPSELSYEQMLAQEHPFLQQLKPVEHLYLYSRRAVSRLLAESGVGEVRFEPPIFAQYDMFFAAAATPLTGRSEEECEARLEETLPAGRAALALLDLGRERDRQTEVIAERETARAAHLEQIETLTAQLKTSEADREAQRTQAERVTAQLGELTARLKTSEADREAQRAQAERVTAQLGELSARLKTSEADREVQRAQAERVTAQLGALTAMVHAREGEAGVHLEQIETLTARLKTSEADREVQRAHAENLLAQLIEMTNRFTEQESESAARLEQIMQLTAMVHAAQAERDRGVEGSALRAGSAPESAAGETPRRVEAAAVP